MKAAIVLLFTAVLVAAGDQEPVGSTTTSFATTNDNKIVWHMRNNASGSNWTVNGGPVPIPLPHTYKDTNSGIIFYVESDGRHISAIHPDGKVLWSRDPFADAHLKFYRTRTPRINYVGKAESEQEEYWAKKGVPKIIAVTYSSSQFGYLDAKTGEFMFGGQR